MHFGVPSLSFPDLFFPSLLLSFEYVHHDTFFLFSSVSLGIFSRCHTGCNFATSFQASSKPPDYKLIVPRCSGCYSWWDHRPPEQPGLWQRAGSLAPSRCGPGLSPAVKAGHLRDGDPLPRGGHTWGRGRYEESERTNQGTRRYPALPLASSKHFVRRDWRCSQSTHCRLPRCVGTTPGPGRASLGPWSPSKPSVLEVLDYASQCLSHPTPHHHGTAGPGPGPDPPCLPLVSRLQS